jgi:hypothetical protein
MPDGIGITEPSDIVIMASKAVKLMGFVDVNVAWEAMDPLFHSIVIADREGVAIGTMLGAEVILER